MGQKDQNWVDAQTSIWMMLRDSPLLEIFTALGSRLIE